MTDEPLELCPWGLPPDAVHHGKVSDCLGLPDHEGPHTVGMAGNGWVWIFAVDEESRSMKKIVHARMERGAPADREEMAAVAALMDAAASK